MSVRYVLVNKVITRHPHAIVALSADHPRSACMPDAVRVQTLSLTRSLDQCFITSEANAQKSRGFSEPLDLRAHYHAQHELVDF